jgi:hypothetical protein
MLGNATILFDGNTCLRASGVYILGIRPICKASRNYWTTHILVGCRVTWKGRIRRRSWPMMKKQ